MTSAFIIQVQPQLQSDPNEETAALLRVLIHKIDNTTFGGDVPALPQWAGPPRTVIDVQSMLYASLSASLLSAFLAMLGKQWLNRYAAIDMRGSAIERSQNRQRKLDGVITWYFEHVMELLPLMLQGALLLLGCALSRYLWEVNTTVASVMICVTSSGALFYFFVVVAGVASDSCPYQTPTTNAIRHTLSLSRSFILHTPSLLRSAATRVLFPILSATFRVPYLLLSTIYHAPRLFRSATLHAFNLPRSTRFLLTSHSRTYHVLFEYWNDLPRSPTTRTLRKILL